MQRLASYKSKLDDKEEICLDIIIYQYFIIILYFPTKPIITVVGCKQINPTSYYIKSKHAISRIIIYCIITKNYAQFVIPKSNSSGVGIKATLHICYYECGSREGAIHIQITFKSTTIIMPGPLYRSLGTYIIIP